MSTREMFPESGGAADAINRILSSASLFILTLGLFLIIAALVLKSGTWPALMVIWGASLIIAGAIAQGLKRWTRRKST